MTVSLCTVVPFKCESPSSSTYSSPMGFALTGDSSFLPSACRDTHAKFIQLCAGLRNRTLHDESDSSSYGDTLTTLDKAQQQPYEIFGR